jgi:DNA polymerase-3 subunit gamma/tau
VETIAAKSGRVTLAMVETADRKVKLDAAKQAVATHPLVSAAVELLGAELRDVRLAEAEA